MTNWVLKSRKVARALFSWTNTGEGELDGGKGVPGFEGADFGQADSVKFLEGEGASAAAGGEIGRERGDAFKEVLCSGTEIEGHRLLRLSAARGRHNYGLSVT